VTFNIASGKQLDAFVVSATNSGAGKLFGFQFQLEATGSTQDSGGEPVRGILGRVINSGTGNGKTTAIRVGATGSGSNGSQLVAIDSDISVVSGTNNLSSVYGATIFGTTDDVASGYLLGSNDGARLLVGWGNPSATKYASAVFRAWLATGSSASAAGFEQLNNAGSRTFYTDIDGNVITPGLTIGGGTKIEQYKEGTATVDPPNLNTGDSHAAAVTVTGVTTSDVCFAVHDQIADNNILLTAFPQSTSTIRVLFYNIGAAYNIPSGTLRVGCIRH
jgi:hypothetical protein